MIRRRPAALVSAAVVVAYACRSVRTRAFVLPPDATSTGAILPTQVSGCQRPFAVADSQPTPIGSNMGAAAMAAGAAVVAAISFSVRGSSRTTNVARRSTKFYEKKWKRIKEDRDPTTLPEWQRDERYGRVLLVQTMVARHRRGEKAFWECRVTEINEAGCFIEMLVSGHKGWCSRHHWGPEPLEVGKVYMMECTKAPTGRLIQQDRKKPWFIEPRRYKAIPIFSHWLWLEHQTKIARANELKAGTIVEGIVHDHLSKGLLIDLDGDNGAKGLLMYQDISRLNTHQFRAWKMFPVGTPMRMYLIHADKSNGRLTLSTKEFEDDDHMGWMTSFPEYCMKHAEDAVAKFEDKRDAYIAFCQR